MWRNIRVAVLNATLQRLVIYRAKNCKNHFKIVVQIVFRKKKKKNE